MCKDKLIGFKHVSDYSNEDLKNAEIGAINVGFSWKMCPVSIILDDKFTAKIEAKERAKERAKENIDDDEYFYNLLLDNKIEHYKQINRLVFDSQKQAAGLDSPLIEGGYVFFPNGGVVKESDFNEIIDIYNNETDAYNTIYEIYKDTYRDIIF